MDLKALVMISRNLKSNFREHVRYNPIIKISKKITLRKKKGKL